MSMIKPLVRAASKRLQSSNIKKRDLQLDKKRMYEKISLNSYLQVCVDAGQINKAFNTLLKHTTPKINRVVDVQHYNVVLKGWARLNSVPQIVETRIHMIRNKIEPNAETYACILLGYSKSPETLRRDKLKKLVSDMRARGFDLKKIFTVTYFNASERKSIKNTIKMIDSKFDDTFCQVPIEYNCKLLKDFKTVESVPYDFSGIKDPSKLESWAEHQRMVEWRSSVVIKSIAKPKDNPETLDRYSKAWFKHCSMWRKDLSKALSSSIEELQGQCADEDRIHIYPYLCTIDQNMIIDLLLDEVETNAAYASYSLATSILHTNLGQKIMTRYLRAKSMADGSNREKQKIYTDYLRDYCTNHQMVSEMTPREFIQRRAAETKNYAIYMDKFAPVEQWPHHVVAAVGRFLYGLILREVKFDPSVARNPKKDIKSEKLVNAFYTAYFQKVSTHKIKEEFRAHPDFEKFQQRSTFLRLKFDYSFLPTSSPPLPWLSHSFGGYLSNRAELVRLSNPFAERSFVSLLDLDNQKLYPSLDALNAIGLCPWVVNTEILDIVIELFRAGGDQELNVPLDESIMLESAPILSENASKADKILYNKDKKKYDQKRREMYSLWRDCLYRLSIANHFRDRVFWFPHNMDFRGRTYPIPPHFNHLGSDLARSLLLFAKGRPLGERGLDWLKLHLINLVGQMKSASLAERLEHANSILHSDVLDSADNPWDGRKWWTRNENPWQVLACCKEIAKAIRSGDVQNYISHYPVHQDGSCNGLQHYAALGRDPLGALAVNLIPSEKPQDVYSRVVDIVEKMRQEDAQKGDKQAQFLEGVIQRKVIKQTVMTTVYGVTRYGARQQIARQLGNKFTNEKDIWQAARYLAAKTFESIGQMFNKSQLIQNWFNDCAYTIASKFGQAVRWETPLGFPVVQPYTLPSLTISNRLLSDSIINDARYTNDPLAKLNTAKQKNAFPPNYIHSLDSSHMMLTSLYCQRLGITFVSVHDCYWTHPSTVDDMNRICREQFVALHSLPLLEDLSKQFIQRYGHQSVEPLKKETKERLPKESTVKESPESMSQSKDECIDQLVEDDLRSLISENYENGNELDEEEHLPAKQGISTNNCTKPLIEVYKNSRLQSQAKSRATFEDIPPKGELDLKHVLKSTYFFS